MATPQVKWTSPAPFWPVNPNNGNGQNAYYQPAILRFVNDEFMDEFMNAVNVDPNRLTQWKAMAETWRGPASTPIPIKSLPTFAQRLHRLRLGLAAVSEGNLPPTTISDDGMIPAGNLKLYQPAHQRYYLITAGLVCTLPGLPDRLLNFNEGEQTSFVIRRLKPNGTSPADLVPTPANLGQFDEYAFIPSREGNRWQQLGDVGGEDSQVLAAGEEKQTMFGVTYGENGASRRILAGMIPVAKNESYSGAPLAPKPEEGSDPPPPPDPRPTELEAIAIQPWQSLIDMNSNVTDRYGTLEELEDDLDDADASASERAKAISEYNQSLADTVNQIQGTSWYILLDLANFIQKYLLNVWNQLPDGSGAGLNPGELALLQRLQSAQANGQSMAQALNDIGTYRTFLEAAVLPYAGSGLGWPPLFSLTSTGLLNSLSPQELLSLVEDALSENPAPANMPALPLAKQQSNMDLSQPGWYIIRCLFERPQCADQEAYTFSQPTEPFQIASFFDPDAPARPIRISMPTDTSPAGLRKFNKNTAFVISDMLACQMERAGNMTLGDLVLSVLPWPFHKSLPSGSACESTGLSIGMICSLSIPIITICALILLIIMVTLLDIIFRWMPFFIMCFPLPSLKGKES